MNPRRLPAFLPVAVATLAFGIAACGGGGGNATPPGPAPTSTPTIAPAPTPTATSTSTTQTSAACTSAATAANCTYTVSSNPAGIAVYVNGAQVGVTPLTFQPAFTSSPQTMTFANSTYSVAINQTGNAARSVFYNSVTDTGNVSSTGNQSVARGPAAVRSADAIAVRGLARFDHGAAISTAGVYVKYDASKLTRRIEDIEAGAGAGGARDVLSSVAAVRGRFVVASSGTDVRTLASKFNGQAGVVGVYPLHNRVALGISRTPPNDAEFGGSSEYQWDLDAIQALYAWSLSDGKMGKIAIVDTGVDLNHPDLVNKIAFQASFVNGSSSTAPGAAQDTNSHGTNVAGIAAASTNDATGFAGVGNGAMLYAYRIFPPATVSNDEQSANTGDEAAAITDAASRGVDVINLSLGSAQFDPASGSGFDQAEHDAIEAAISSGVTVVAASGNGDANNVAQSTIDFPAAYDGVIAAGASAIADNNIGSWNPATGAFTGTTEVVASYSNYGPGLGVVAPGGDTSTAANSSTSDNLHWIVNDASSTATDPSDQCRSTTPPSVCALKFQGTSQATPHVSGTVALVQSALKERGSPVLSPAAMLQLIDGTADNIGSPYQGHGRLNALRAVASALGIPLVGAPTPPPSAPTQFVAFAYTNSGASNARPAIADVTYPNGLPVNADGTFRIADIPAGVASFKVGVWLDANGDGVVDAGDQFGASTVTCTASAKCTPGAITIAPVTASNFVLP